MAALDPGVPRHDVQIAARHADPRTTTIYDRRREHFDRHAAYVVVAFVAGGCRQRGTYVRHLLGTLVCDRMPVLHGSPAQSCERHVSRRAFGCRTTARPSLGHDVENAGSVPLYTCEGGQRGRPFEGDHHGRVTGVVRFTFHAGMVDAFKRLSAQCMEIVRSKDVGTLQYDTYFNDDESQAIVLERFHDSLPR